MKPFSKHLSFEELVEIAADPPDDATVAASQSHLADCDQCRMALSGVQRMLAALGSDELLTPPRHVTARALRVFVPSKRGEPANRTVLPSLVALLRFDSGLTPAYGMRSGQGSARQLLFNANEYDIDIRLEPRAGAWHVEGQLLGGSSAGLAELSGAAHQYAGELDEMGEFSFSGVRPDSYSMRITLPDVEITIPDLMLEP